MRPSLSLATLFRSPVRTALTAALLGLASFAFFVQVGQYAITKREFERAALQYRGVGAAEAAPPGEPVIYAPFYIETDPRISANYTDAEKELLYLNLTATATVEYNLDDERYQPLTWEQIAAISSLPYIAATDLRYMTAGISDVYQRLYEDVNYWPYTARSIVEATLEDMVISMAQNSMNDLFLSDCKVLAGHYPHAALNGKCIAASTRSAVPSIISASRGEISTPKNTYTTEFISNLVLGQRYVFVLRYRPLDFGVLPKSINDFVHSFGLSDYLTDPWCASIQSLEGEPANCWRNTRRSASSWR
jgi:hypothetical protein